MSEFSARLWKRANGHHCRGSKGREKALKRFLGLAGLKQNDARFASGDDTGSEQNELFLG
jgi:hypothetical protein